LGFEALGGVLCIFGCQLHRNSPKFIERYRPVEVMCWADTKVNRIEGRRSAIDSEIMKTEPLGQFEVS